MEGLIEALQIMLKYAKGVKYPTFCSHDKLEISPEVDPNDFSEEDILKLYELGFSVGEECGEKYFYSFKYGSC